MTTPDQVRQHLEGAAYCALPELHVHLAPALRHFRFVPQDERRACADAFVALANSTLDIEPVRRAYFTFVQAMDRFMREEHESALQLLAQARGVFVEVDDSDGRALCDMLIGATYRTLGHFDLALKVLWGAFELLKTSNHYPIFLAATANSLAHIRLEQGELDDALAMFEVTRAESERADDFYFLVYGLHGLARVRQMQQRAGDAEALLSEALRLAERHDHPIHIATTLTELATLHFVGGDLDLADALCRRALAIREERHLLGGAVTNCVRLAEIQLARNQWTDARATLERALAFAEQSKVKPKMAQAHLMLSSLFEKTNDLAASLAHYQRYHALREEVAREDSARQLNDAKLIFAAEQTQKENAIIRAQKVEIERKNVELQNTIDELTRAKIGRKAKAFTLAVAIVLFIFQDAILGTALRLINGRGYFVSLAVKMAIIFSLSPINRGVERYLLRRVLRH